MKISEKLNYQLYLQREEEFFHQPYSYESDFYQMVVQGDLKKLRQKRKEYQKESQNRKPVSIVEEKEDGKGKLSGNPVRNEMYHFVVNVGHITRICIEAGLPSEEAYTLSDVYIRTADEYTTVSEIKKLNDDMVWEFTRRMHLLTGREIVSFPVSQCIQYIYDHLHEPLRIESLAGHIGWNASYLSTTFKKETGSSVSEFIRGKRLETAENMLRSTSYSYSDIALTLCFSSQSHFIRLFRERNGMTPKEYRNQYGYPN